MQFNASQTGEAGVKVRSTHVITHEVLCSSQLVVDYNPSNMAIAAKKPKFYKSDYRENIPVFKFVQVLSFIA